MFSRFSFQQQRDLEGFLGITAESDPDDPIYRTVLSNYSIAEFEESGIHVVKLEQMI